MAKKILSKVRKLARELALEAVNGERARAGIKPLRSIPVAYMDTYGGIFESKAVGQLTKSGETIRICPECLEQYAESQMARSRGEMICLNCMENYSNEILPEEGVTEVSLTNARRLVAIHGVPVTLDFKGNPQACVYDITAKWDDGYFHTFTGFSWGYAGTGPAGLDVFLELCGCKERSMDIPITRGKTDATLNIKKD